MDRVSGDPIKRKRLFLVTGLIALTVLAAVLLWPGEREPEYQGRKLSEWLEPYTAAGMVPDSILSSPSDVDAIRHMGTNALPLLVKWIRKETSRGNRNFSALVTKAPTAVRGNSWVRYISDDPGISRGAAACAGFRVLGATASSAVPELTLIANNPKTPEAAGWAAYALGCIGEEGFGPLAAILSNPSLAAEEHARAAWELGRSSVVGTNGRLAVPVLIKALSHTNVSVSINAATSLGNLAIEPELVVPALIGTLNKGDLGQRYIAASALERFGTHAEAAVPALLMMAGESQSAQSGMRAIATNALAHIAPDVFRTNDWSERKE